jgi:hypothetical protein
MIMQIVRSWRPRQAIALMLVLLLASAAPAAAFDLFARHEVTVEFSNAAGQPMSDAEVKVFAPGQLGKPVLTGRTDQNGRFSFAADQDGFWSAEARINGEIGRVTIRVGGKEQKETIPPEWLIGGLFVLLILAFSFRIIRARLARRKS